MPPDQPLNWLDDDQPGQSQDRPRFAVEGEEDGTWSVYDTLTGLPGILEDQMLVRMTFEMADDMMELLNKIDRDAKRGQS